MPTDENVLDAKYSVLRLQVISSNSIQSRTSVLIKHLTEHEQGSKTRIAGLTAKASVANKLISVVEIAKRELAQDGRKVYQYSALGSTVVRVKGKAQKPKTSGVDGETKADTNDSSEDEEAFEVMAQAGKVKTVPVLTVYLSLVPIKELRDAHGEQVE